MATFKGLAEGFANNNEISKKLLKSNTRSNNVAYQLGLHIRCK